MKNVSLILNIVLILAVLLLYIDRFSGNGSDNERSNTETYAGSGSEIVYVNLDSLMNSYDMYNDLKTSLIQDQQKSEASLNSKSKAYQRKAMEFQQKVEKRLVTNAQAEQMQQQLISEQQSLMQLKEQLQMQLLEKEQVMNKQIFEKLNTFLKKYNSSKKHKIILGNSLGSNVLEADSTLNITDVVLNGLNAAYQSEQISDTDNKETE